MLGQLQPSKSVVFVFMTLRKYLPELARYLNFNQFSLYLVSERLLTPGECKYLLQPQHTRQYRVISLVEALESTGPNCYQRFRRALERSLEEEDAHMGHEYLLHNILPQEDTSERMDLLRSTDSGIAWENSYERTSDQ